MSNPPVIDMHVTAFFDPLHWRKGNQDYRSSLASKIILRRSNLFFVCVALLWADEPWKEKRYTNEEDNETPGSNLCGHVTRLLEFLLMHILRPTP